MPPLRTLGLIGLTLVALSAAAAFSCGCRTTPVTNRKQLVMIPESQEMALGESSYREILASETLSQNKEYIRLVKKVGQRISAVAGRPDFQWEFNVLAGPTQNAFCLPGGKVAVYEGLLPVCENEAGLAVVMSHEIAHALARHGGERMSQQGVVKGTSVMLGTVTSNQSEERRAALMAAYSVGAKYGFELPYSRQHESEADHIGLLLMAEAGYDPREAPRFWDRFSAHGGPQPPELLSTHPSDETRSRELAGLLPAAMTLYEEAPIQLASGEVIRPSPFTTPTNGGGGVVPAAAFRHHGHSHGPNGTHE